MTAGTGRLLFPGAMTLAALCHIALLPALLRMRNSRQAGGST